MEISLIQIKFKAQKSLNTHSVATGTNIFAKIIFNKLQFNYLLWTFEN